MILTTTIVAVDNIAVSLFSNYSETSKLVYVAVIIIIIAMIIMMMFVAEVTDFDYEGTRKESHSNPWGTGDQAR